MVAQPDESLNLHQIDTHSDSNSFFEVQPTEKRTKSRQKRSIIKLPKYKVNIKELNKIACKGKLNSDLEGVKCKKLDSSQISNKPQVFNSIQKFKEKTKSTIKRMLGSKFHESRDIK